MKSQNAGTPIYLFILYVHFFPHLTFFLLVFKQLRYESLQNSRSGCSWIYSNIYIFYTIFVHIARGKTRINAIILPADSNTPIILIKWIQNLIVGNLGWSLLSYTLRLILKSVKSHPFFECAGWSFQGVPWIYWSSFTGIFFILGLIGCAI